MSIICCPRRPTSFYQTLNENFDKTWLKIDSDFINGAWKIRPFTFNIDVLTSIFSHLLQYSLPDCYIFRFFLQIFEKICLNRKYSGTVTLNMNKLFLTFFVTVREWVLYQNLHSNFVQKLDNIFKFGHK